ncbi:MAG: hypothetical protein ABIR24_04555 [Verrucomicrobiota bacterium]
MKTFCTLFAAVLLIGCASPQPQSVRPAGKVEALRVGMSKEEVLAAFGHKPKHISQTARGESWYYDNSELAMIPFNLGFRLETKQLFFGPDGRLTDWNLSQPAR